jgi:aspartate/methionine/tyrosine aminotransferase
VIGLILTSPDNPTGNYTPLAELRALVEHAVGRGIGNVFLDLMYQAVTDPEVGRYDVNRLCLDLTPEALRATCIMDGLTKSAGASNVRSANLLAGDPRMVLKIKGIATHTNTPNCLGEAASLDVYGADEPDAHPWIRRVTVPTSQSRKIVRARFSELGYRFICDQGYYAFLNVHPWLGRRIPGGMEVRDAATGLVEDSIRNVETLKSFLTTRCGLAIIHGSVFNQPHFIRFSYANAPEYTAASIDRLAQSLSLLE